jgi:ABC-type oligopeptide transport system substrate-binding subunit
MQKNSNPVGFAYSGPFVPVRATAREIILKRNPWYYDRANVKSDWISIRFLDPSEIATAYLENSCDWTPWFLPFNLLKRPDDLVLGLQYATGFYYFCNPVGPYGDPKIRKAFALLAPWDQVSLTAGELFTTNTLVPGSDATPLSEIVPHDPLQRKTMAFNLLEEAGYPEGEGLPQLSIAIPRGNRIEEATHLLAEAWSGEIGVTVVLDVVPLSVYSSRPAENPYELAYITWIADFEDPFAFLHLWETDSSYNLGNFSDPEFDSLMQQALLSPGVSQRMQLMHEAESLLLGQAVVFPVMHGLSTHIIDSEHVTGWHANPLDIHPLKYLYSSR